MSIELDIELPLSTPFIFTPTHFQIFTPSLPMLHGPCIFPHIHSSSNQHHSIVRLWRHIINAWWPTMSLLCSTCSTHPRKNCKKSTKKFKVSKKYSKKPKNPSKNFYPLDWVPTKLMALFQFRNFNFGICGDKDAFIKEVSSSPPILFYSKTVSMMYPLPSESFHWLSTFQADDWPIRTDFHWCYPRLEKSKATIF